MLDRMIAGVVPAKPHTALRDDTGRLRYEECLTRDGFDGPYTILYHQHRPHTQDVVPSRARLAGARARRKGRRRHGVTAAGAPALPHAGSRAARRRAARRRARAVALQPGRHDLGDAPRAGRPGLLLQRRRRRPVLHLRGRRHAAHTARRPGVPGERLRLRAARVAPSFPARARAAVLVEHRVRRRLRSAQAMAQRGRPASHGRAVQPPRLSPPRLPRALRGRPARSAGQAARRVPRLSLSVLAAGRRRLGRHGLSVGVSDPALPAARRDRCTCRRRCTARSRRAAR